MRVNKFYKLLISAYCLSSFSEGIILPIYAIFVQKVGGDILEASGAMALFLLVEGIFTILVHRFHWSKKHRRLMLIGGWIIWVLGIFLYFFISNILTLLITQVFTAIGNAVADPVFDAELAENTDRGHEEFEYGFFEGSKSILDGIAALLGGVIVAIFGFKVLIIVMVSTATVSLGLILIYARKKKTPWLAKFI